MKMHFLVSVSAMTFGCTETAAVPAGNTELGIVEFQSTDTPEGVHVIGVDANMVQVAWIDVRVGHLKSIWGPGTDDFKGEWIDGRQLSGELRGQTISWEDAGMGATFMPNPKGAMAVLVHDPYVEPLLASRNVIFQPLISAPTSPAVAPGGEVAYNDPPNAIWTPYDAYNTTGYIGCCVTGTNPGSGNKCGATTSGCYPFNVCGNSGTQADSAMWINLGTFGSPYNGTILDIAQMCASYGSGGVGNNTLTDKSCNMTCTTAPCTNFCSTSASPNTCSACTMDNVSYDSSYAHWLAPVQYSTEWVIDRCSDGNCG